MMCNNLATKKQYQQHNPHDVWRMTCLLILFLVFNRYLVIVIL